jgi:hypothetical protein
MKSIPAHAEKTDLTFLDNLSPFGVSQAPKVFNSLPRQFIVLMSLVLTPAEKYANYNHLVLIFCDFRNVIRQRSLTSRVGFRSPL